MYGVFLRFFDGSGFDGILQPQSKFVQIWLFLRANEGINYVTKCKTEKL